MSGPSSRPVETPAEWLRFAEENLAVAQREKGYEQPAHHTICFLCHSAAAHSLVYLSGNAVAALQISARLLSRTIDGIFSLGREKQGLVHLPANRISRRASKINIV